MDIMLTMIDGSEYISHHGILGQKWGIRRYQNKDGTLTSAGKRRLATLESKRLKIDGELESIANPKTEKQKVERRQKDSTTDQKNPSETTTTKPKRSVFEMSNDELRVEIERLELQKRYKQFLNEMYPSPKTERYFNGKKVVGDALSKGLTNAGANVVETSAGMSINKIGKMLGLDFDLYTKSKKKDKD